MKELKNKVSLRVIKSKTLVLRSNYQLPSYLTYLILALDTKSNGEYVKTLMELSENYLRIKGYYKKYPKANTQANADIKKILDERRII